MLDNPKQFLSSLPNQPGVYQMYDANHQILYVGKAKNLKKRVSSYFRSLKDPKTVIFMSLVKTIEIMITPSENAALLLESNLIKLKKPRYNILFKDDRSFPYLLLSRHDFPRLSVYRGAVNKALGTFFGPFPSAAAVHFVYELLQKIFRVRVCQDSFLCNRSRTCMLYQIKLCSAPCVGYINKDTYALQIKFIKQFLNNSSNYVVQKLTKLMDSAAENLDYERAANCRDQIKNIHKVQSLQAMTSSGGNYDVAALVVKDNEVCISVLYVRNGLVIGNKNYFPGTPDLVLSPGDILTAFVTHYYLQDNSILPDRILFNMKLPYRLNIAAIFQEKFKRKIVLLDNIKGVKKELITMAEANASNALLTRIKSSINYADCLLDFKKIINLSKMPKRIECFDVSHSMGEAEVASCVIFNERGPVKKEYRRFNIKNAEACDDYGALQETLLRRYRDLKSLPDVIIIDGGKGQLNVGHKVLQTLQIKGIKLIAIAKGKERKPGLEEIYIENCSQPLILPPHSKALHFMQQIRDEAHRFAITGHRRKMQNKRQRSELDNIFGVGKTKRALLIKHFGGLAELRSVGINDLMKVKGINCNLAKRIYEHLHA